jgi:hypothetical protein
MLTHADETTGRLVRQLTTVSTGAQLAYFRLPRNLPDGRVLIHGAHEAGDLLALDPESGEAEPVTSPPGALLRLRESDGCAWFWQAEKRELWEKPLPAGEPRLVATVPVEVAGDVHDVTCDGRTLIGATCECEPSDIQGIFSGDYRQMWRWIYRRRSATLWAWDTVTGRQTMLHEMPEHNPQHVDCSPTDPGLLKFAQDGLAVLDQRIHAVRVDGSDYRPIRPQAPGEWVHHEFWWPGGELIGYKFMDRAGDATLHQQPWAEFALRPLQLGIANLRGEEIYRSDPLGHYHSHLNVSADGRYITGEGTHDYSFACLGSFDMKSTALRLEPYATVHTPYLPAAGQGVECHVSPDGRWLLYNDTVEGVKQVCAVKVEG